MRFHPTRTGLGMELRNLCRVWSPEAVGLRYDFRDVLNIQVAYKNAMRPLRDKQNNQSIHVSGFVVLIPTLGGTRGGWWALVLLHVKKRAAHRSGLNLSPLGSGHVCIFAPMLTTSMLSLVSAFATRLLG